TAPVLLTFADGVTQQTIDIPITDDTEIESSETLNLSLTNVSGGATLGTVTATTLTINDNDVAPNPGSLAFSSATYSITEGQPTATITVVRTDGSSGEVSVEVDIDASSSASSNDYSLTAPVLLTFADGVTQQTIDIPITDDTDVESSETLNLSLTNVSGGATLGSTTDTTLTILDNDVDPAQPILIEAETLSLSGGYRVESDGDASGGQMISLFSGNATAGDTGTASLTFAGTSGSYDIVIGYFDENDGVGQLSLDVAGTVVETWQLSENTGSGGVTASSFRTRRIASQSLINGDVVTITGTASDPAGEWARVDYIELIPVKAPPPSVGDTFIGGNGNQTFTGDSNTKAVTYAQSTLGINANLDTGIVTRTFSPSISDPLKIMPLGDSITYGVIDSPDTESGGYRIFLWNQLDADGHANAVDFVGSLSNGPSGFDSDHEGRRGWKINQISAQINGWISTFQPDTVLLKIGTNDILQDFNVDEADERLSSLIDQIHAQSPNTHVLVGSIVPITRDSTENDAVNAFNALIPGIVEDKVSAGQRVSFVDLNSVVTASDIADGIHPTSAGYEKIATAWYDWLGGGTDTLSNIDNLVGSFYDDTLVGNSSDNILNGGEGNDILRGGLGNDTLAGGLGNDTFVLETNSGTDIIFDFDSGIDILGLSGGLSFGDLTLTQGTGSDVDNTLIIANNQTIASLSGIQATALTSNDFITVS
ncbi:MAG: GDSL-type esterase/lipase family protein, partial [Cyanobacteria bacterium J06627_8]